MAPTAGSCSLATVTTPAGTTSYSYDADGNQLIRTDPDTTTLYLPMQDIVRDNTTGTLTGTRYYTHNDTTVAMRVGGNNLRYVQSDQHNTAQVTVTTPGFEVTRRSFDPYGNPIGAGQGLWPDSRGFLNMPHNPVTGLTDVGARKYDPTTGTFISVDPVLDTANPQQWNPYAYSNNNPVTYSDPSGLYCDLCNFYPDHQDGPEVGVSCPPCTPNSNQPQKNDPLPSGKNTDPRKQPTIGDRRVPTYEELKNRPGFAHYRSSGTYQEAISDWAKEICSHAIEEDQQFCSVASNNGWLEPSNPALHQFLFGLTPISDLIDCVGGSSEGCVWLLANFVPGAKGLKAAEDVARYGDDVADVGDAAHDVGRTADACVPNSFVPGTQVMMANGTHKPIEDIQIGDKVLATDPLTGETGPRRVEAIIRGSGLKRLIDLTADTDDVAGIQKATVTVTDNHPFWLVDKGIWLAAADLRLGDLLYTPSGVVVPVISLKSYERPQEVLNLAVDEIHTFYVLIGELPVLVHNTAPGCVTSVIGDDPLLAKEAQKAGNSQAVQRDIDNLTGQLAGGNMNPGIGSKALAGTDVMYARGRNGGRVFFRNVAGGIQIVGKASKSNESKVIGRLTELYGQ